VTPALVERVVQHAISFGLFQEDAEANIGHNAVSSLLVTDPDLESWLYLCTNYAYPAGAQIPKAIEKYGYSSEANETGYSVSIGRKISQFERLREPDGQEAHAMFARAMRGISAGGAYDVAHAIDGYPWEKLAAAPNSLVVDVGGGPGHVAMALARKFPSLRFEVQDLPETVEVGAKNCPPELRSRITFKPHDFFQRQPARDREAGSITYFARFILHDWSDTYARKILDALAKSLRPQDRVVLNEVVVPAPGELALGIERRLR
jgi:6-hydroxytryprostatin B O-methyltransferase